MEIENIEIYIQYGFGVFYDNQRIEIDCLVDGKKWSIDATAEQIIRLLDKAIELGIEKGDVWYKKEIDAESKA